VFNNNWLVIKLTVIIAVKKNYELKLMPKLYTIVLL